MRITHRLLVASMVAITALPLASAYTIRSFGANAGTDQTGSSSFATSSTARMRTTRTTQSSDTTATASGFPNERAVMNYLQHQYCNTLPSAQRTQCLQPLSGSERTTREATFHTWYLKWMQSAEDQYRMMAEGQSSSRNSSVSDSSSSASSESSSVMGLAPAYWQDVNGNWLKIQSDQVVWSTNQGQSWNSVANRTWQGPDGWYRFDNDWKLSHSASGTIWQSVDDGMWPSRNGSMFSLGTNGALTQRRAAMGSDASNGWQMSTQEYWTAKNNQWVKYMNGRLLWSTDSGTSWTEVPGGAWQQANGDWYKFNDSQLQVSTDGGITWQDATDNAWQGSDGTWYKYDANGHLMARLGTASTSSSDTSNASSDASTTAGNRAQQMRDDFAACQNFSPRRRTDCFNRQHEMRSERSGTSTQNQ